MNKLNPQISVLMSVFNGEEWLAESIESIINQSYKNFEFIIINDGSQDKSREIIEQYAIKDKRIIKINNESNEGLTKCLNKGVLLARGAWIARLDCDDISLKDRLKEQYEFAIKEKCHLLGSFSREINNNQLGKIFYCPTKHSYLVKNLLKQRIFFSHSSAFFLKNSALKLGNYRVNLKSSQDYDLWLRFSEKYKISCLPKVKVYIRNHSSRITYKNKGIPQKSNAYIALVSSHLRRSAIKLDPIDCENDELFQKFANFVYEKLKNYKYIDFYEILFKLKSYNLKNNKNLKLLAIEIYNFFKLLINHHFIYLFIKTKIYGRGLIAKKIAKEWATIS